MQYAVGLLLVMVLTGVGFITGPNLDLDEDLMRSDPPKQPKIEQDA